MGTARTGSFADGAMEVSNAADVSDRVQSSRGLFRMAAKNFSILLMCFAFGDDTTGGVRTRVVRVWA